MGLFDIYSESFHAWLRLDGFPYRKYNFSFIVFQMIYCDCFQMLVCFVSVDTNFLITSSD